MRAFWLTILLLLAPGAWASGFVQNTHARVDLIAGSSAGTTLTLGIRISPQPGWHSYWVNPGEAGAENRFAWTLPPGAVAGKAAYPVPEALLVSGIMNHVYSRPATLLVDVALPARPSAPMPVGLTLDYLVCSADLCVPEHANLSATFNPATAATDFADTRAALPRPLAGAVFARANGRFVLLVPTAKPFTGAHFFPAADGAIAYSAAQTATIADSKLRLETAAASGSAPARVAGVLRLDADDGGVVGYAFDAVPGPVPAAGAIARSADRDLSGLPIYLLAAVAGGLVLNVMPCVFPILSLKALSLARAGADAASGKRDAWAYAAGVIATTTALGGVILGLKAAGVAAGWAFQLQDPRAIVVLLLLMTAIALNLAGLFELNVGGGDAGGALAARPGRAGAFWTGALAAFVATPCTGPFMGAALGAALALPAAAGLAIFAGLGVGLALPFVALAYSPWARRRLPRPGPWMARMRHLMSVPMFTTALGLAWVLGHEAGIAGMTLGLAAALALGLALWWFGGRQREGAGTTAPLGLALAGALAALLLVSPAAPGVAADTAGPLNAKPFTEAALVDLRARHRPVFVYFTADWCITCKVNERGALADPSVARAFAAHGITTLVGDWTRGDPAITRFLEANGRSGVPLYLYYGAGGEPRTLPQLLTPARLSVLG